MGARANVVREAFAAMLGPQVAVAACPIGTYPLWPEEAPAMDRARPARRAEFSSGREAARQAMAALGHAPRAVPMQPDRAPRWPDGLVGSISHSAGVAVAALAPLTHAMGLGIDIEPAEALAREMWDTVLTGAERDLAEAGPEPEIRARELFCAKEALYKAQYPITGQLLDFSDVSVSFSPSLDHFLAVFQQPAGPFAPGDTLVGITSRAEGLILSTLCMKDAPRKKTVSGNIT